jgi:CRP-like cAMP-binding protein
LVNRLTRRIAWPGDFFGEIATLEESRRSATVTTIAAAKLLVMFGSDFRLLQEAQPGIAARIEEAVSHRLSINT